MAVIDITTQPEKKIFEGFYAQFVHTEQLTIAYIRIEGGSKLPAHAHPQEQVTTVLSGELEMTIGDETRIVRPGQAAVIPSNVLHSARALTTCQVTDVFTPVREDFKLL